MPDKSGRQEKDIGDYFTICNAAIVVANIVIFLIVDLSNSSENTEWMLRWGAMYWPYVIEDGQYYRLITAMFLHFGVSHLFNNMLVLWFIGGTLEKLVGHLRYVFLYFISGILADAISMGYNMYAGRTPVAAGASGAVFGITGALLYVVLIHRGRIEGFTTRQMIVLVFLSLYGGFTSQGVDNMAHLGGFVSGFLLCFIIYRRPKKMETYTEGRDKSYDAD